MSNYPLDTIRHSAAHVMAAAVQKLYPDAKFDIGPATENGFYYDFDMEHRLVNEDLKEIEKQMKKLIGRKLPFEHFELPRAEAEKMLKEAGQPYKLERLADIPEGEKIGFYKTGDFVDLCRGPHVANSGDIGAVKLLSIAGSYFRGDEKNKMLQRIYGTAFASEEELKEHIRMQEEAAKRDHRKLGQELDLFSFSENVGPGLVLWHPKGAFIRHTFETFWKEEHYRNGYQLLYTPHIGQSILWETSGHLDFYREGMYSSMQIDEKDYYVKPMNCPFHIEVYQSRLRSYRELPLRVGELGLVHRHELSGALHGLFRVRCFTQDDAHIFMTWEQMKDEIKNVVRLFDEVYSVFGLRYEIEVSTMPEDHMGDVKDWDFATETLKAAVTEMGKSYVINEGDGAFYGPKLDFHLADSLGRTWQCGTIQLDMQLPERFELEYTGADGEKHRPVMIHRVVLGSIERFIGIITEHYAGAFPVWLAPVQVRVLTITDRANEAAEKVAAALDAAGLRVEKDLRNEKIGKKIAEGRSQKIPYLLILGDKEAESGTVAVRSRGGDEGVMALDDFIARVNEEVRAKKN